MVQIQPQQLTNDLRVRAAHQRSARLQHQASCRIVALSKPKLPHASRQRPEPAQPTSSKQGDSSAATTRGSTRATSRHTVARASVEASAARVERAGRRLSCRHPRQHTCRLLPHRGARQRRSQRSPRRASRVTAQLPRRSQHSPHRASMAAAQLLPPEAAHVPPRSLDADCAGFYAGARHGVARGGTWLPRVAAAGPSPCSLNAGCAGFYAGARHGVARGGTCAASGGGS